MPDHCGADIFRPDFLRNFLLRQPAATTYHIAYSGGLDSTVLLHICSQLRQTRPDYRIRAIHVHHGLQAAADDWANHCENICEQLDLPINILRVQAKSQSGQSPEEAARNARYAAIRTLLKTGDALLTAQHQDDQAETLLLQLFRGAGLAGLAGMAECKPFHSGHILRPLLGFSRDDIRAYATHHQLQWIEDSSNDSNDYDRNYLRNRIMPQIRARWPSVNRTLSRSAGHCAEASKLLETRARTLLNRLVDSGDARQLSIEPLRVWPKAEQKLTLRVWLSVNGYRMPPSQILESVLDEILANSGDRAPRIHWPEGEIRRYRNTLFLLPPLGNFTAPPPIHWNGTQPLNLPGDNGVLIAEMSTGPGISLHAWKSARISVRGRKGGERLHLPGRQGRHELKKLFQAAGIPPWVREHVPLIYLDETLTATALPFWVNGDMAAKSGEPSVKLEWRPPCWIPDVFTKPQS